MSAPSQTATDSDAGLDLYIDGVKNAHALEKAATQLIERQLERLEHYPEVSAVLTKHLAETKQQVTRLDEIMGSLGTGRSVLKDFATSISGNMAALGHTVMTDEVLKNHFANHAFENFEIASYISLIALAEATGRSGDLPALRVTLEEEKSTAQALIDMTPALTRKYLQLSGSGQKADR